MPLKTKSVRDPAATGDGRRILITRYWPRGVSKDKAKAEWDKRLSPSPELIAAFKKQGMPWREFAKRFRAEMKEAEAKAALAELRDTVDAGDTVTLMCQCPVGDEGEEGVQCHRRLVKEMLA